MDPAALASEITNDPAARGYAAHVAAGSDAGVASLLNAKTERGPVPIIDVSAYCTTRGITGALEAVAHDPAQPVELRALCFSSLSILRNDLRLNTADMDDPACDAMLGGLVSAGLITPPQRGEIVALGAGRRSRAELLFGVGVTQADVSKALRGY